MAIVKRGHRYGARIWDAGAGRHRRLGTFERLQDAKRAEADATRDAKGVVLLGVRPGELAALRWCDLDIPNRRATIRRALDGQGGIKPPKNGKARRVVLPPPALRALGMVPRPLNQEDTIFHTPRGKRLTKGTLAYLWRPIGAAWRARGGQDLDLHELRHARATLLLERGLAPADVAVLLGHTDGGRLVMTLYGHPNEDRARDRLDIAFAADGHNSAAAAERLGYNSATGGNGIA